MITKFTNDTVLTCSVLVLCPFVDVTIRLGCSDRAPAPVRNLSRCLRGLRKKVRKRPPTAPSISLSPRLYKLGAVFCYISRSGLQGATICGSSRCTPLCQQPRKYATGCPNLPVVVQSGVLEFSTPPMITVAHLAVPITSRVSARWTSWL